METEKVGKIFRKILVDTIKDGVENNDSTFLLSYSSVSAIEMDGLRKGLKPTGASVYIAKNRLARIALRQVKQEKFAQNIEGQTAFVWGGGDSVAVSKVLMKFIKECKGVTIKGGLLEGAILEKEDVQRMSELPSREVLLAQLLQVILSPLTRLAGIMNSKSRDLLSILKQLSEKKGGS